MRNKIESSVHRSSGKLTLRRDRLKGFCLIGDEIVGRGQREEEVSASAAASMRTVVVRFADADAAADAAAYYIATADFIGVCRRTRRSDAASDAVFCVNETNKS
ncbi:hypothetical protein F2Q68_00030421 [Brassica cretica]|uniref:Uncharacterized protein n=1 Tax=Brassica cretica TaxID=69181 RepID=A0A8S9GG96_BRACR|nr:hypothetical protein F2Q68_00030421 [Brassica cretica]